ncbi:MAG: zinc ribbon domain-containing protein [Polyangiaceae bacterium]
MLALATVALALVVFLLWSSVASLDGKSELSLDEALSYGAPSAEEEQKLAVLRALKDLEFERSVGKISEQDFQEFSARYRAEAKRLIAQVDESLAETRKLAEQLAEQQLLSSEAEPAKSEPAQKPAPEPAPVDDPVAENGTCPSCQTANDPDALFCKRCGKSLSPDAQASAEKSP